MLILLPRAVPPTITFTNLHLGHVHTSYGEEADEDPDIDDDFVVGVDTA